VHEASIVRSVIRLATARVPDGAELRRVHVRVGALTGVSPESMRFYFDAMRPGGADLVVTVEPLRASCAACRTGSTVRHPLAVCPACAAPGLIYENGLELDLVSIEVADALDDSDRGEDPR
jgi:hydrogenase nickel incorporation protein HypA/HybF